MRGARRGGRVRSAVVGVGLAAVAAGAMACAAGFHDPPRFDGAGYAVLGEALAAGRGYREVDHPDAPRHAHFPPGYPAALALLWRLAGRSTPAAHAASVAATAAAVLAAWVWFRRGYGPRVADPLAFALAVNWTWVRTGGAIQSEPLYLLLSQLAVLATLAVARKGRAPAGAALGALLGAVTLTRHVGAALGAAAVAELWLRGRRRPAGAAVVTSLLMITPWAVWLATVQAHTQAGLLAQGGLAARVVSQGWFYVQRLPDALTGPVVEIATVFGRSPRVALAANAWAVLATSVLLLGLARTLRAPRRRLAGLVAGSTLALLLVWPFTEAGRFLIPLVPCLLIGATEGLAALARPLGGRRARVWAAWLVLAASLPYSAYALATDRTGAQRQTHAAFDAACTWVAQNGRAAGPLLTRHPGEAYWQTGRHALTPESDDPAAVAGLVDRYGVAYLIVDDERYANAPASPLAAFVAARPEWVRTVWTGRQGRSTVTVYEVVREPVSGGPGTSGGRNPRGGGSSASSAGPS